MSLTNEIQFYSMKLTEKSLSLFFQHEVANIKLVLILEICVSKFSKISNDENFQNSYKLIYVYIEINVTQLSLNFKITEV
jgi:hypothetical protein